MSRPGTGPAELDRLAVEAAGAWIEWWSRELHRDGRGMSGGWPGTLSEARARVSAHVAAALGNEHVIDAETLDTLTHRTYSAARAKWLSRATRDPNP